MIRKSKPLTSSEGTPPRFLVGFVWLLAAVLVVVAGYLGVRAWVIPAAASNQPLTPDSGGSLLSLQPPAENISLPTYDEAELHGGLEAAGIVRESELHTIIPTRPRTDVITHTVEAGDSIFGIATQYNLDPETVLWANYDTLKDNPDMISIGMVLNIPPVDGVYYEWQAGDTIKGVADKFNATPEDILGWLGNEIDLINPQVEPGKMILVKGGSREFVQWIVPTIPRGRAGVSKSVYGPGACEGSYDGAYGSGAFIWPSANHTLSGNDYWSGHLAIDIATGLGDHVWAADAGVVVFAGWSYGGYGNMVMIDHGNGYQTVYAHLNSVAARCGQSVGQGTIIAYAGSSGNSTGPHLHFEIRYLGGFVNPWYNLP